MRRLLILLVLPLLLGSTLYTQEVEPGPVWTSVTNSDGSKLRARHCRATSKFVYGMHWPADAPKGQMVVCENGKTTLVTLEDGAAFVPDFDKACIAGDCLCVPAGTLLYRVDGAKARPITLGGKPFDLAGGFLYWATQNEKPLLTVLSSEGVRVYSLDDTVATEVKLPEAARKGMPVAVDGAVMCIGGPSGSWLVKGTSAEELLDEDEDPVRAQDLCGLVGDLFLRTWNQQQTLYRVEKHVCLEVELPEGDDVTQIFRLGQRVIVELRREEGSTLREWKGGKLVDFAPVKGLNVQLAQSAGHVCLVSVIEGSKGKGRDQSGSQAYYRLDETSCRPLKFPERAPFFEGAVSHGEELLASFGKESFETFWMPSHIDASGQVRFARTAGGVPIESSQIFIAAGADGFYAFCELPRDQKARYNEACEVWFCKYK